jgi:filamentous hemagglutinin
MNAGFFRLVFSAVRGMRVAVGEHACARRGGARSRVHPPVRRAMPEDPRESL